MEHGSTQPPGPPEVPPRLRMRRVEFWGVAFLAVLPICALLGLFGPTSEQAMASSSALKLEVVYPTRLRFHLNARLLSRVTNEGQQPLDSVVLSFSDSYLHGFSALTFTPSVDRVHAMELNSLAPGETRTVTIELRADRYGRVRGDVIAESAGTRVSVPLDTLVFP